MERSASLPRRRFGPGGLLRAVALVVATAIGGGASAQDVTQTLRYEDAPAQVRLGMRVEAVRRAWPVAPIVVVVPDAWAYLDAIGLWTPRSRFPVLIDDGTPAAREAIGMFVRAFAPRNVVWWEGRGERGGDLAARIDRAVAHAWGAQEGEDARAAWERMGYDPPGVVVASERDPAWTAAAALAAARGQPIVWTRTPRGSMAAQLDDAQFGELRAVTTNALDAAGYSWRGVGEGVDAVTLCYTGPTRIAHERGPMALTDAIGREGDGARWAWAGIVSGDGALAAQRAMCAIFLQPERAWLFDGYTQDGAFARYDVAPAQRLWEEAGRETMIDARPGGTLERWRQRARAGVDAGFIHVNTMGNRGWFQLADGRAYATDVPVLHTPAMVHFIHSFSAQNMSDGDSVGAAWLERGAYAYCGSVDEPTLAAFLTPQMVSARLLSGAPWGVAVRLDDGPAWKVNVFGDPLITVGRTEAPQGPIPAIEGGVDVETRLRRALRERRFDDTARDMAYLARDADILRLALGVLGSDGADLTPGLAGAAFSAMTRTGEASRVARIVAAMDETEAQSDAVRDRLWLLLRPSFATTRDRAALRLLRRRFAGPAIARDAAELAEAVRRLDGVELGRIVIMEAMEIAPEGRAQTELLKALDEINAVRRPR